MPTKHAKHGPSGLKYKNPETGGVPTGETIPTQTKRRPMPEPCNTTGWRRGVLHSRQRGQEASPKPRPHRRTTDQCGFLPEGSGVASTASRQSGTGKMLTVNGIGKEITFGTSDVVLVTGKHLTLIDYKFGTGYIDAPEVNMQAKPTSPGRFKTTRPPKQPNSYSSSPA